MSPTPTLSSNKPSEEQLHPKIFNDYVKST